MQEDDTLPRCGEVTDGLLELRGAELAMVAAKHEQVGLGKEREGFLQVRRRSDIVTGGLRLQRIGAEEERGEVVRATSTSEEHA